MLPIIENIAAAARSLGILDEIAYRNLKWKIEFEQRISEGCNVEELLSDMAERYFLSVDSIRKICYPQGEKKVVIETVVSEVVKVKKQNRRPHYVVKRRRE